MDRVAVLWSDPTAHRPREVKGPMPSRLRLAQRQGMAEVIIFATVFRGVHQGSPFALIIDRLAVTQSPRSTHAATLLPALTMSCYEPSSSWRSPFHHQLHTNYVPSDDGIEQIRAHLMPYEAERTRLDSLIEELTVQRNRLHDYIEPHKALISYPRRLPQDVVEEIFLACLPIHHNAVMSVTEAPLLLGRICSAWRSIAFAMPRLWASLHISVYFVAGSKDRTAAAVNWLQRSAPVPLSISLAYNNAYDHNLNALLVEQIFPFSTCWHALSTSRIPLVDFSQLTGANAPLLADVKIAFESGLGPEKESCVLSSSLFRGMDPQRVTITAPEPGDLVPSTPFRWDHLTDLTLHDANISWGASGLDCATAYRDHPEPLTSSLESLIINVGGPFHFRVLEQFVGWLVMPRLERFNLVYDNSSVAVPMACAVFLEHFGHRSPLISDLRLNLSDFTINSVIHVLQLWPRLVKLNTGLWCDNHWDTPYEVDAQQLLTALTPDASTTSPCPSLQELITESDEFADEILVDFLQAQLDFGTNLRRIEVNFRCERPAIVPDIQHFLECGLEVSLSYVTFHAGLQSTPWDGMP
ncbi:hypothetical protein DFH06DRAFT_1136642 [Mycena polygramma]|nr:hypothetical protein DFH06DRAFT_1136642 [Mycena polygramma]